MIFGLAEYGEKPKRRFSLDTNLTKWLSKCEGSLLKGKEKNTIIWCDVNEVQN